MDEAQKQEVETVDIVMPEETKPIEPIPQENPQLLHNDIQPQEEELSTENPQEYKIEEIELGKFTKEKLIEDYIFENINLLWEKIFNEKIKQIERQKSEIIGSILLNKEQDQYIPKRGVRIDLYLECESGNNYLVEIKNPKTGQYDTMNAIGKLLFYSCKFPQANKLVLLSSLYEEGFLEIIQKYNLPIDFVLFTHDKAYLLKK